MPSHRLNQALSLALDATKDTQHLARFVERYARQHPSRLLSQNSETALSLQRMLTHYVQLLPIVSEQLHAHCKVPQLDGPMGRLTTIICEFLETMDPQRLKYGLIGVLDKAYFGHRLWEEFHDRLRLKAGVPLIQWDLNLANLIVHSLIGEDYANRLDMVVMEVIDSLDLNLTEWPPLNSNGAGAFQCLAMHHGLSMGLNQTG